MSPAVTQRLLNEIGDDPDRLPVLQHALMRTWQEARGRRDITLKDYENTGGIADAISRHADEVFDKLPSDEHRRIAERMFKAISELSRGRAIRRTPPLLLDEIRSIADAHADSVVNIIEAFRAPECCFLMPPVPAPLDASTPIDISHESLLRGWAKMGTPEHEGWLVEEDKDGKTYRSLVDAAEAFASDEAAVLPPTQVLQRKAWRAKANPNAAWAERYGNKFDLVARLLDESERRQRWQRTKKIAAYAVLISSFLSSSFRLVLGCIRRRCGVVIRLYADKRAAATRQLEVGGLQTEIEKLRQQLKECGVQTGPDDIAQQTVQGDPKLINSASSAVTNQDGFVWIGSVKRSNLQTTGGTSVSPTDVRVGEKYNVVNNIYLRQGLPDEGTYAQKPSIGVLSEGTTIEALGQPKAYPRPTENGDQYWLSVRVIASTSLACPDPVTQPLVRPPEFVSSGGILEGTINLTEEHQRLPTLVGGAVACAPQLVRVFKGEGLPPASPAQKPNPNLPDPIPGPTLRARVGDLIQLKFVNKIDPSRFNQNLDIEACMQVGKKGNMYPNPFDKHPNCLHASSTANIHFHGTHTNPNSTGDNVYLQIRPLPRDNQGELTTTPAEAMVSFEEFFKTCRGKLKNPLEEWPTRWSDLPKPYTDKQTELLKAYQTKNPGQPILDRNKRLLDSDWPQYYIGAYPYCFALPAYTAETWPPPLGSTSPVMGQAPGTHWYHARKHGSTAINVANGMTGAFIIEGKYDDDLNAAYAGYTLKDNKPWKARSQPVLVLNQLGTTPNLLRGGGMPVMPVSTLS